MKHWINSLFNRSTSGSLNPNYLKDVKFIYILYVCYLQIKDLLGILIRSINYSLFCQWSLTKKD